MSETHPALAAEAIDWDPAAISFGSQVLLDWVCPLGHVYQATPNNRSHGTSCSYCSSRKVLAGFNDLKTLDAALAAEAIEGDPSTVTRWSHQPFRWRCSRGHEWVERVSERSRGYGCPYCSGQRVLAGFNDLCTTHPETADQSVGWDASRVSRGSNTPVMWRCELGHHFEATPNKRTSGRGCPYCAGNRVLVGYNDLATKRPDLAVQAAGWDPTEVTAGSNRKLQWRCEHGHEWEASVKNRVRGRGCPICRVARWREHARAATSAKSFVYRPPAFFGKTDVRTVRPDLAEEAVGWLPECTSIRSHSVRLWRCHTCTQEWEAPVVKRDDGEPCPYCSGKRVLPGVNDLATLHPELASQALGWDPSHVLATTWKKLTWVCERGHDWVAPVGERRRGYGCPYCAGRKVWVGFNDLETTDPDVALEADGWLPTTVTRGHEKKKAWCCGSCGHRWQSSPNNRTNMHSGCPSCAEYGYSPGEPGYLYFLKQSSSGLLKIGITNVPAVRMAQHRRRQWSQLDLIGPENGEVVRDWERAILREVRAHGAVAGPPSATGNVGGFTETWRESDLSVSSLRELLKIAGVAG